MRKEEKINIKIKMADIKAEVASEESSPKKMKEDDGESKELSSIQDNSKTEENDYEMWSPSSPFKTPSINLLPSSGKNVKGILKPPTLKSTSPTPPSGNILKSILKPAPSVTSKSPNSSISSGKSLKGILKPPTLADPPPTKFVLRQSGFNPFNNTTTNDISKSDNICDKKPSNGELKFVPLLSRMEGTATQTFNTTTSTSMSKFVFGQNLREKVVSDSIPLTNNDTNGTSVFGLNLQDKVVAGTPGTSPTSSKYNSSSDKTSNTSTFVFGQNLHEKVVTDSTSPSKNVVPLNQISTGENLQEKVVMDGKSSDTLQSTSKDTSETLFSSAINTQLKAEASKEKETKSLTESAKEYEEARANKRKYDEVEVKTGEEEEINILSMSCKLFAYDNSTRNWQERGRGTLRLNDYKLDKFHHYGSRVVVRASGSLRVILNTKIFADMTLDKANDKTIRMTAIDSNGEIKIFLIMSSKEDSRQLFLLLEHRLEKEINVQQMRKLKKLQTEVSDESDQV